MELQTILNETTGRKELWWVLWSDRNNEYRKYSFVRFV